MSGRGRRGNGGQGRGRGRRDSGRDTDQYAPPGVYQSQEQHLDERPPPGYQQPAPPTWGSQGAPPPWGGAPEQGRGASGHDNYPPLGGMQQRPPPAYVQEAPGPGAFPPLGGGPAPAPAPWQPPAQAAPSQMQYSPSPTPMEEYAGSQMSYEEYEPEREPTVQPPMGLPQMPQRIPSKALNVPDRPKRPGFGTKGRQIKLLANWFKVKPCFATYDVSLSLNVFAGNYFSAFNVFI